MRRVCAPAPSGRTAGGSKSGAAADWLAGRAPLRATGYLRTANPERHFGDETFSVDVDDGAFALLDFGDGLIGRIAADATHAVDSSLLAVHGETLTAVASGENIVESRLYTVDAEETAELELAPDKHANLAAVQGNLPAFVSLLDEFAAAIDGKPADYPSFADGLATQRVLAAIGYGR